MNNDGGESVFDCYCVAVSHRDDDDSELLKQDDVANFFVHMYEINTC